MLTPSDFDKLLQGRMDRNPTWRVLSVHVAMVTMPNAKFDLYGLPMYVVEITGPETGNCFDLYYATDGSYWGSSCFHPTRDREGSTALLPLARLPSEFPGAKGEPSKVSTEHFRQALFADGMPTAHGGARWHASTVRKVLLAS